MENGNLYIAHHGVKGQKHGFRQWQNLDGSLTPAGRVHYGVGPARNLSPRAKKKIQKIQKKMSKNKERMDYAERAYAEAHAGILDAKADMHRGFFSRKRSDAKNEKQLEDSRKNISIAKADYAVYSVANKDLQKKIDSIYQSEARKEKIRNFIKSVSSRLKKEKTNEESNFQGKKETPEQMWERLESDSGYIKVKDRSQSGTGGHALVKIENKKTAATSLSYLGYSEKEIAEILGIPIDKLHTLK